MKIGPRHLSIAERADASKAVAERTRAIRLATERIAQAVMNEVAEIEVRYQDKIADQAAAQIAQAAVEAVQRARPKARFKVVNQEIRVVTAKR